MLYPASCGGWQAAYYSSSCVCLCSNSSNHPRHPGARAVMGRFLFLILYAHVIGVSRAASPAEVYWHTVLPKTPMPGAIHDILAEEEARTAVNVTKGGLKFNISKGNETAELEHSYIYNYRSRATEIPDRFATIFFLQKDLHPGANKTIHFIRTSSDTTLLPRRMADSIPFSSSKLPEIYARLSIKPNSVEAKSMKKTFQDCEEPAVDGETKYCATSLESMVDFSTSNLGTRNVRALSTTVDNYAAAPKQVYTMSKVQKLAGSKFVSCHVMNYIYVVFYCHAQSMVAYTLSLVGNDGTMVEAVAACHTNTAKLNPNYLAFRVLHVKPGTLPICHFLLENGILWSPNR